MAFSSEADIRFAPRKRVKQKKWSPALIPSKAAG
jgi:hypothetical protein